jgi:hypothetical protein
MADGSTFGSTTARAAGRGAWCALSRGTGDRGLEKLCVIKTVLPHLADAGTRASATGESCREVAARRTWCRCSMPGQVAGELFLAMDFVEGGSARGVEPLRQEDGRFPVDVAVIVKELCRGSCTRALPAISSWSTRRLAAERARVVLGRGADRLQPGVVDARSREDRPESSTARSRTAPGAGARRSLERPDLYARASSPVGAAHRSPAVPAGQGQPQDRSRARAIRGPTSPQARRACRRALDAILLKALEPIPTSATRAEMRAALAVRARAGRRPTDAARSRESSADAVRRGHLRERRSAKT